MMKKFLAMLLATVMVLSLAACSSQPAETQAAATEAATQAATQAAATQAAATEAAATEAAETAPAAEGKWNLEGTMFPLAEPVTFTILASNYRYGDLPDLEVNEDWLSLCAETNVNFEFVKLGEYDAPESGTNLQMRLMSGDYGDAVMTLYLDNMTIADIEEMAAAGIAIPFDDFMMDPTIMPYFNEHVVQKNPHLLNSMKFSDGKFYSLFGVKEDAKYTQCEGLMQVNQDWLKQWQDAKGIDHTPQDLAEFEDMLQYFKDNDMNGNGDATDEIPYFIPENCFGGNSSLEACMGMFGIGQKDSGVDMDIMINDDGQCYYTFTTDEYKAAIKQFGDWYQKGLIWEECLTGNADTINSIMAEAQTNLGVVNMVYDADGFDYMLPPKAEGYTAKYHTHPNVRNGADTQPQCVITDKCEHPEILAAFYDLQYDMENTLRLRYGSDFLDNGGLTYNDEGLMVLAPAPGTPDPNTPAEKKAIWDILGTIMCYSSDNLELADINSLLGDRACVRGSAAYIENNIWNTTENLWPRCSLLAEVADDYTFLFTDIHNVFAEYRAKFLTGQMDVDAEWDNFQAKLKELKVDDAIGMIQQSYDAYLNR